MGYTFISFVGQQNLGVQNPLEACLQAKILITLQNSI
mgnify:CR=1 FL=1